MTLRVLVLISCIPALFLGGTLWAQESGGLSLTLETGPAWSSRNVARIPNEGGTRFALDEFTGDGPQAYLRVQADYAFNERHSLRLTAAPFSIDGTGIAAQDIVFEEGLFRAGEPLRASYRFNTYRLTWRWTFHQGDNWTLGVGAAALIRDAQIALSQGQQHQSNDDLGLVPLAHFHAQRRLGERSALVLDVEGLGAPQGRAIDAILQWRYALSPDWDIAAGYRTLEGGADNDDLYTFAWLHFASLSATYHFG